MSRRLWSPPKQEKRCGCCRRKFKAATQQTLCSDACRRFMKKHKDKPAEVIWDLWSKRRDLAMAGQLKGYANDGRLADVRGNVSGFTGHSLVVAATDASIRDGFLGLGYIVSDGRWGLVRRPADKVLPPGLGVTDVAELRAVAELLIPDSARWPIPDMLIIDSRNAVRRFRRWRHETNGASKVLPPPLPHLSRVAYSRPDMRVEWARGHTGHLLNEAADSLASIASRQLPDMEARERGESLVRSFLVSWHAHDHAALAAAVATQPEG